jgi:DNA (cytosine-5)-methyltransferase 1
MFISSPYYVLDDEGEEYAGNDSDLELLDYGKRMTRLQALFLTNSNADSDSDEPMIFNSSPNTSSHRDCRDLEPHTSDSLTAPDVEIKKYRLSTGIVVEPGDTVELIDQSEQDAAANHSGDFLRVKHIIMGLSTDQVRLRGHILRRTKYVGQVFDCKSPTCR